MGSSFKRFGLTLRDSAYAKYRLIIKILRFIAFRKSCIRCDFIKAEFLEMAVSSLAECKKKGIA